MSHWRSSLNSVTKTGVQWNNKFRN
jgi:hypothetical protein